MDLARAALGIAAEDDALVSHSSVPLPVDLYMARIDGMATEFAGHHLPERDRSPSAVFDALDNYMYVYQVGHRVAGVLEVCPLVVNAACVLFGITLSTILKRFWLQASQRGSSCRASRC